MKKITKEQIVAFRSELEAEMRNMYDKHGNPCISEDEIKEYCHEPTDDYIAHLIENKTTPASWAEIVTSY